MPEKHEIRSDRSPWDTVEWLNYRRHACVVVQPPAVPQRGMTSPQRGMTSTLGELGLLIRKKGGGPTLMAIIGDTLSYDGADVTIE